jgi:MSHA biogenesis protein MshJ
VSTAWERVASRIDALETKERVLVGSAALLVVVLGWYQFLYEPMLKERQRLQNQNLGWQAQVSETTLQMAQVLEAAQRDPDAPLRERLAATNAQIAEHESEIRELAGQLITPQQMALILRSVLEQVAGLEFVGLEGLGAEPLLPPDSIAANGDTPLNAFRHGFRITFRGSYLDALAYLRALEGLPWRFFWDGLDIAVEQHPQARTEVVVYTLSLERSWIGV